MKMAKRIILTLTFPMWILPALVLGVLKHIISELLHPSKLIDI